MTAPVSATPSTNVDLLKQAEAAALTAGQTTLFADYATAADLYERAGRSSRAFSLLLSLDGKTSLTTDEEKRQYATLLHRTQVLPTEPRAMIQFLESDTAAALLTENCKAPDFLLTVCEAAVRLCFTVAFVAGNRQDLKLADDETPTGPVGVMESVEEAIEDLENRKKVQAKYESDARKAKGILVNTVISKLLEVFEKKFRRLFSDETVGVDAALREKAEQKFDRWARELKQLLEGLLKQADGQRGKRKKIEEEEPRFGD
ncbi:unnamed protein product [Amoebophrya sp. A120]|nr:unnamed protein product [Amoebophrya sp. A120]|eukprot:GSA120T00000568001.1